MKYLNKKVLITLSTLFIITIMSFSYGYWKVQQDRNGKSIDITGTIFDVSFENENNLNISNAKPIYESEYLTKGNYIDFTVTGKSTILEGCYDLELDIENISNELKNEYFKWVFYDVDSSAIIASGDFSNIINNTISLFDEESLTATTTNNYRIYVYLAYNDSADQTSMLGTEFEAKIKATASTTCASLEPVLLSYTGDVQKYTVSKTGTYRIELWGAQGGTNTYVSALGGYGAYTSGDLLLQKNSELYIFIGGQGPNINGAAQSLGGFNGGGGIKSTSYEATYDRYNGTGGGATDVSIVTSSITNNLTTLRTERTTESYSSRIMVAGGGGGGGDLYHAVASGGNAGGLIGYSFGGTQIGNGIHSTASDREVAVAGFGLGATANAVSGYAAVVGGGAGYFGGAHSRAWHKASTTYPSGGGSSFISGHTGCVTVSAIGSTTPKSGCTTGTTDKTCSEHPNGFIFTNTKMIDGSGNIWTNVKGNQDPDGMPNPLGGNYTVGLGHSGNGYARITYLHS